MKPLASVIVAAFQGEKTLGATLQSLLAQTTGPLEVIVVDDGSKDGTARLAESFGSKVQVVRQANAGVSAARNLGARCARADLLAFLDQDDLWEPHWLQTQVGLLAAHPEAGFAYADSIVIDARGAEYGLRSQHLPPSTGFAFDDLLRANFVPIETLLLPRRVFESVAGFDPRWRYLEDWQLCLEIALRHPIVRSDQAIARYRIHGANLTHRREAICAEWAELLRIWSARPEIAAGRSEELRREARQRDLEAAWHALRRLDHAAAAEHRNRAGPGGPIGLRAKLAMGSAVFRALDGPPARWLAKALRPRRAYGVELPDEAR